MKPPEFKDYYQTLGVARTASPSEIRKAFRELARLFHPDVAQEKNKTQAEEKFKEINEAYEVLGDPEKRQRYDDLVAERNERGRTGSRGANFRSSDEPGGGTGGHGESESHGSGFSDFFEYFFGPPRAARPRGVETQTEVGKGTDVEAVLRVTLEEAMSGAVREVTLRRNTRCSECGGDGASGRDLCPKCAGEGEISMMQTHRIKIPAGIRDGQRLRVPGHGEPAGDGETPGDLFLRARLASHPDFRVEGGDLYYDLDLAPWEAALGVSVSVPALDGPLQIKIPPATQNGQRLRLKEQGLPARETGRGDLFVVARIQMPKEITEQEKALWERLARESPFRPRS